MTRGLVVSLTVLAFAAATLAQERTNARPDVSKEPPAELQRVAPGVGSAKRTITDTVKVKEVDLGRRVIVVENSKGASRAVQVSPTVKRLDQVSPGDTIQVWYEQTLVLEHRLQGSGVADRTTGTLRDEGGAPGAMQGTLIRRDVEVTKIDEKSRAVTLDDGDGKAFTVKAGPDIDLAKVKVGQTYYANYTEITAVKLVKPTAEAAPVK